MVGKCCNATGLSLFSFLFIIIILIYLEHQIISKLWISLFSSNSDLIKNNFFSHLLYEAPASPFPSPPSFPSPPLPSPRSNFLPACCLLGSPPLLSLTACDLLFSHAGWGRNPGGEGGERRGGRARMYFPEMTFLRLLCSAVINWGLLLQGQQGAAGTAGMKGQKVSHAGGRCHIWLLPLFVLPAPRLAQRRGGTVGAAQAELYR